MDQFYAALWTYFAPPLTPRECQACGLAPLNNRSLDLRRKKGQADEAAAIWCIRSHIEHGQSGIILVRPGRL